MPVPVRQRDSAASTARLLTAATAEFAERGYEGARVDRISAASGFNKALLFQRFGDKEGLYRAVLARVAQDAQQTRALIASERADPRDRDEFGRLVRDLAGATADFLAGHAEAARILAWERASGWHSFNALRPEAEDAGAQQLTAWFADAADHGWLRDDPPPARQLALVLELVTALLGEKREFIEDVVSTALLRGEDPR
ncbi:helix-turn-helix domain-containing protein [Microbacterium sp. AZCO]|uniref:TetR/AcrR family transcriptional regulator n=1 Tax=Microbacterium sp. AZCO TaxID=3142976 RepID=UPI0031F35A47